MENGQTLMETELSKENPHYLGKKEMALKEVIAAIEAAQVMAERTKRVVCVMPDLSLVFDTEYSREKAVEIVHPVRFR